MFRPVVLSLLFVVLLVATAESQAPKPQDIPNPVKMFRTTMKSWRTVYQNYKEEMDLGYCWADYFFDVKSFINTLSGPKVLGPNRVAVASLKALLRSWLNEPSPPKPSPVTWYEKILLDSPPVPTTTEPASQGLNSPKPNLPPKIDDTRDNPEDNSYPADEGAYSEEDYGNDEPRPIPYTYLNPTQIQQPPNQGQPTRLPQNQLLPQGEAQLLPQGQVQLLPQGRGEPVQGQPIYPPYVYRGVTGDSLQRNPQDGYDKRGLSRRSVIGSEFRDVQHPESGRSAANGLTLRTSAVSDRAEARGLSDLFVSLLGFDTPPGVGALKLNVAPSAALIVFARIVGTFFRVGRQVMDTIDGTSILACTKNYLSTKFFRWIDTA